MQVEIRRSRDSYRIRYVRQDQPPHDRIEGAPKVHGSDIARSEGYVPVSCSTGPGSGCFEDRRLDIDAEHASFGSHRLGRKQCHVAGTASHVEDFHTPSSTLTAPLSTY
jgi:hypothetical protein